jgi:hypothetical protein
VGGDGQQLLLPCFALVALVAEIIRESSVNLDHWTFLLYLHTGDSQLHPSHWTGLGDGEPCPITGMPTYTKPQVPFAHEVPLDHEMHGPIVGGEWMHIPDRPFYLTWLVFSKALHINPELGLYDYPAYYQWALVLKDGRIVIFYTGELAAWR